MMLMKEVHGRIIINRVKVITNELIRDEHRKEFSGVVESV